MFEIIVYFLCALTPELSRPVAGRRTRASVAQKHVADATTRGRLERIVRPQPEALRASMQCGREATTCLALEPHSAAH
jgi:hypothetical protein